MRRSYCSGKAEPAKLMGGCQTAVLDIESWAADFPVAASQIGLLELSAGGRLVHLSAFPVIEHHLTEQAPDQGPPISPPSRRRRSLE